MTSTIFSVKFDSSTSLLDIYDHSIPQPSNLFQVGDSCIATWCIKGYFGTVSNMTYFNDVVEKVYLLLNGSPARAEFLKENMSKNETYPKLFDTEMEVYKLSDFVDIEDVRYFKGKAISMASREDTDDRVFDKLRKEAYMLKKLGLLTLEKLQLRLSEITTNPRKYKSKVINVYNWTVNNYTGKVIKADTISRCDNALVQTRVASDAKYDSFKFYMKFLEACSIEENVNQLSKSLKISWRTAKKYLKKYLELSQKSAMTFIQHIRDNTHTAERSGAAGKSNQRINMSEEKLKELIVNIKDMKIEDVEKMRDRVSVSAASAAVKYVVLKAIRLRTHGMRDVKDKVIIIDGDYDATDIV